LFPLCSTLIGPLVKPVDVRFVAKAALHGVETETIDKLKQQNLWRKNAFLQKAALKCPSPCATNFCLSP
jgi:hypothetical protein